MKGPAMPGREPWVLLILIVLAVAAPTVCLLWFLGEAVQNERMAVRQRLSEFYQVHLAETRTALDAYWAKVVSELEPAEQETPEETFARLVSLGVVDSLVVLDPDGAPVYPARATGSLPSDPATHPAWQEAERLEYKEKNFAQAAEAFAKFAASASEVNGAAMALRAQARNLLKTGETNAALRILSGTLAGDSYRGVRDADGHLIAPAARLRALELTPDRQAPSFQTGLDALVQQVGDYVTVKMPSAQRIFLMNAVLALDPEVSFPTLAAEELAEAYLAAKLPQPEYPGLVRAGDTGWWHLAGKSHRVTGMLTTERVLETMDTIMDESGSLPGARLDIAPVGSAADEQPFLIHNAGDYLPDWELRIYLDKPDPFAAAARKRISLYVWTALLAVLVILSAATLAARYLLKQMKLNRLKSDFVATVSHELKTPLASMRVLVDTLLDGKYEDHELAKEYLELIARENERLSRLIDNFLTFSRMERNKQAFTFTEVAPGDIVRTAIAAVQERFDSDHGRVEADIAKDLPMLYADADALVTVLLNLLDNAYKYSGRDKEVCVRARASGGMVSFEVLDNGIGLSRHHTKKVLERFYQVDQSLSRGTGGCGLGLSIVNFIVEAHQGTVSIESEPNKGTNVIIRLPIERTPAEKDGVS